MARTEWNRGRTRFDGAAPREAIPRSGHGWATTGQNSGVEWIRSPPSKGDEDRAMTCLLRRMYRDIAEEPLPESFNALVQRLRGAKNDNGTGGRSH